MRFYNLVAFAVLISAGVIPVRVQRTSLEVVWNFLLFLCLYVMYVYVRVCMYVSTYI